MSDVKPGDVFETVRTASRRRVRVLRIDTEPTRGGNGCLASGPVAVCESLNGGRQTRINVALMLKPYRWRRIMPTLLLCLLLAACETPSPAARRACAREGRGDAVCVRAPDLEDGTCAFRCTGLAAEDAGVEDAGADAGGLDLGVDAGLALPVRPTRVR